jgi:glutamate N-acetyltransferase/amino-acid N-acetyltransferase
MISNKGLSAVKGFKFAGIAPGGKKKSMGLLFSTEENTLGTAVYTRSDVKAAPVAISQKMDSLSKHKRAVLINSGIANAFTGKQGLIDAERCITELSKTLDIRPSECYIASTGVIGKTLDMDSILNNMGNLTTGMRDNGNDDFVEAIMTTDTRPKQASVTFPLGGKEVTIAACAKGSGMIMPDMATMLSVVITDAAISHELLAKALGKAIEDTFNCITVDGDTSTNDSVFLLANGLAGNETIIRENEDYKIFYQNLRLLLEHMAKQIVDDGEGITKFITIDITNTPSRELAKKVAFSIANSPLVKTAFYGQDLNWGRILMAVGKAMTKMDCSIIDVFINGYRIVNHGEPETETPEYDKARKSLKNREIGLKISFNQGDQGIRVWTCDFSLDYVKINAHYTT